MMASINWAAKEVDRRRDEARRNNWTKQKIEKARENAPAGRELEAEAKVIQAEVERRAALILKHPEWAEIWGVEIVFEREHDLFLHRPSHLDYNRRSKPFIASIMSSVASCDWYVREGWDWTVDEMVGGKCRFRILKFDHCAAGESLIINSIYQGRFGGGIMNVCIKFVGGREIHILEPQKALTEAYLDRRPISIDELISGKFGYVVMNASTGEMWQ